MNKIFATLVLSLTFLLVYTICSVADDKIVFIPFCSTKKTQVISQNLKNIITVSKDGGDFTNPVAAIQSINDAGIDNPYLVFIGPGTYTLSETLYMKEYVSISGAGKYVTELNGAISTNSWGPASAIISSADNSSLRNLSIKNIGGDEYSIALVNNHSSPLIQNVKAEASGGNFNYGVYNVSNSSPTMEYVEAIATGGTGNYGVYNYSYSSPVMDNLITNATGSWSSFGVFSTLLCSPIIKNSTIDSQSLGIIASGLSVVRVIRSSIINPLWQLPTNGTITCVNSDNGVDTELDINCFEVTSP